MTRVSVEREIAAPAEATWKRVADFGDVSWIPPVSEVEVEGSGVGMKRIINGSIHERLESLDEATMTLVYSIPEGLPFPVRDYRATIEVRVKDAGTSQLAWRFEAEPDGISEEETEQTLNASGEALVGWLADSLEQR